QPVPRHLALSFLRLRQERPFQPSPPRNMPSLGTLRRWTAGQPRSVPRVHLASRRCKVFIPRLHQAMEGVLMSIAAHLHARNQSLSSQPASTQPVTPQPARSSGCPMAALGPMLGRGPTLLFGLLAYAAFVGSFLYAVGFVGNWLVPK